jgi:hypothetical protein
MSSRCSLLMPGFFLPIPRTAQSIATNQDRLQTAPRAADEISVSRTLLATSHFPRGSPICNNPARSALGRKRSNHIECLKWLTPLSRPKR